MTDTKPADPLGPRPWSRDVPHEIRDGEFEVAITDGDDCGRAYVIGSDLADCEWTADALLALVNGSGKE